MAGEDLVISVGLDTDTYTQDLATVLQKAKDLLKTIRAMPAAEVKLEFGAKSKAALERNFLKVISDLQTRGDAKAITLSAVASDVRSTRADDSAAKAAEAAALKRTAAEQKQQYDLAGIRGAADAKQRSAEQKQQYDIAGITQAGINKRVAMEHKQQYEIAGMEAKKLADAKKNAKAYAEAQVSQLPKLRYALYDVAAGAQQAGQNLIGMATSVVAVGASYETAFTGVERTMTELAPEKVQALKKELMDLATQIPLTFQDLSGIATLGSQLGIGADSLGAFTETVAQFSAVTNVSTNDAATAFGKIGVLIGVTSGEYEKFGSAVAAVGVDSAATETEILNTAKTIAGVASTAKFTAAEVIALSGTLAALAVPPEKASGALITTFKLIKDAVSANGPELQKYATLMGMTTDETAKLARTDMSGFFNKFIGSLSTLGTQQLNDELNALSLNGIRTGDTLTRLAGNFDKLTATQTLANKAFAEGTFLNTVFGTIADDLQSRMIMLGNSFQNISATIAQQLLPVVESLVTAVQFVSNAWAALANNPATKGVLAFVVAASGIAGVLAIVTAASLKVYAGTLAMATGLAAATSAGFVKSNMLTRLIGNLFGVDVATLSATAAENKATGSSARRTVAIAALNAQLRAGIITQEGYTAATLALDAAERKAAVGAKALKIALITTGLGAILVILGTVVGAMMSMDEESKNAAGGVGELTDEMGRNQAAIDEENKAIDERNAAMQEMQDQNKSAAKSIRTLSDYAKDLSSVWSRAFSIRFDAQRGLDGITKGFQDIAKATKDANDSINSLTADLSELTADKATTEYFLSIALSFGDTIAAAQLQAELDKINNNITTKTDEVTVAQQSLDKGLTGTSAAAIANRATITGLVAEYQGYIGTLANSGLSQEALAAQTALLEADFMAQAAALGFNTGELENYRLGFVDVQAAITAVDPTVTTDVRVTGMDAANIALAEFVENSKQKGAEAGAEFSAAFEEHLPDIQAQVDVSVSAQSVSEWDKFWGGVASWWDGLWSPQSIKAISNSGSTHPKIGFSEGGYTGSGSKMEVAGITHKGEYVVPANEVNQQTKKPYFMEQSPRYFSGGASTGNAAPTSMMVELSPTDRQLLAQAGNVQLSIDGRVIAGATNGANNVYAQRGTN